MTIAQPAEIIAALDRTSVHRTTPIGANDVVWRVWGQGPPLVLLHGGTGSWMHWVRNIEALAHDFTLLVPDLPGSGESAIPRPPISADSIGARGAMEPLKSWRRLASDAEKAATHRHNLGILMIHDAGKIDALAVHMQQSNAERSRIRGKHVSHTGTLAEGLAGFGGRLAGIWGEFDATAVPYVAERGARLRQFQPQASFEIFAGAGHWVQYEAAEQFNIRLRELVKTAL
jgi:pimeloyl-ACP methyl ester carboxylesterase